MAYLNNVDTSAKVGFRPYHLTDAFGAAHLSGMGAYEMNRPFDPWELYSDQRAAAGMHGVFEGLGQGHNPFKPEAWTLHGLGDSGSDVATQAADDLLAAGHITQAEHDAILDGQMSFQDVVGIDPTDQSSWLNLPGMMRDWNNQLTSLEQQYGQIGTQIRTTSGAGTGSPDFQQYGRDLIAQRQQYNAIAYKFVGFYVAVMGSAPPGLSGLGIAVVAWAIGAAAFIVLAYVAYQGFQVWHESHDISKIQAQTAQTQAQTQQSNCAFLQQALAKAQAAGDTITANTILAQLKQCGSGPATDLTTWFTTNAKWLALFGVGMVVLAPLSQGLFGRGRR